MTRRQGKARRGPGLVEGKSCRVLPANPVPVTVETVAVVVMAVVLCVSRAKRSRQHRQGEKGKQKLLHKLVNPPAVLVGTDM